MKRREMSTKEIRQRRFMLVMPLLVLPFMTLLFWTLGDGKAGQVNATVILPKGFNIQLPSSDSSDAQQ